MRNWSQVWQVCQWEFLHFFKLKQEIISKLLMLAIGLGIYFWQGFIDIKDEQYNIAITNDIELTTLPQPYQLIRPDSDLASQLTKLDNGDFDAVLSLTHTSSAQPTITMHTVGKLSWHNELSTLVSEFYSQQLASKLGIDQSTIARLQNPVNFTYQYLDQQVKSEEKQSSFTAIGLLMLIGIGVFMTFAQIFVSITGEKQQRVTEQLYACMNAQTWIDGKILGQMLHAVKAMIGMLLSILIGIAFAQVVLKQQALNFSFIDFSLLPIFIPFALLGLYMVTAFMAAIAAAIDDPNHSGKSSFMMLPLLPIILCFFLTDSPSSVVLSFMSYFPLTAFAAMPMKMALIDVAWWQISLSLLSTLLGCFVMRVAAGRMFEAGMVMYGKEPSLKQMFQWAVRGKA